MLRHLVCHPQGESGGGREFSAPQAAGGELQESQKSRELHLAPQGLLAEAPKDTGSP